MGSPFSSIKSSNNLILAGSYGYAPDPEVVLESVRSQFLPDFHLWIAALLGVSLLLLALKALVGSL